MAKLLTRYATADDEADLVAQAADCTVREMRARLTKKTIDALDQDDANKLDVRTTRWVSDDELVMLNASRVLVEYVNGARASDEALLTALLGEAETSLQSIRERTGAPIRIHPFDAEELEAFVAAMQEARAHRVRPERDVVVPPVIV